MLKSFQLKRSDHIIDSGWEKSKNCKTPPKDRPCGITSWQLNNGFAWDHFIQLLIRINLFLCETTFEAWIFARCGGWSHLRRILERIFIFVSWIFKWEKVAAQMEFEKAVMREEIETLSSALSARRSFQDYEELSK